MAQSNDDGEFNWGGFFFGIAILLAFPLSFLFVFCVEQADLGWPVLRPISPDVESVQILENTYVAMGNPYRFYVDLPQEGAASSARLVAYGNRRFSIRTPDGEWHTAKRHNPPGGRQEFLFVPGVGATEVKWELKLPLVSNGEYKTTVPWWSDIIVEVATRYPEDVTVWRVPRHFDFE